MKTYHVYILASRTRGATYIGVTGNLDRRIIDHANGAGSDYCAKWNITRLVYFEEFQHIDDAIRREKQLKSWKRQWKFELIETENPDWEDLSDW